ncbi:MAG: oxidoreductase [Deltaproteobacteria bacterium]|nr:oxidoreductase [Deltaproteobacteria bacterium]
MSDSKKIRPIRGIVTKAIQETPDTWTLHLEVKPSERNYLAGQFLSISPKQFPELSELVAYFEHKKGKKELIRAYSMASAPHEPTVSFTIRPERFSPEHDDYAPFLSPFLASPFMKGREFEFLGYTGPYILPANLEEQADQVVHLVAGSGAVPNFSLLKDQLIQNKNPSVHHTLIDINRTYEDIIYRAELEELAQKYPKRFTLVHRLTREERPGFVNGRPTFDLLREHVKDPSRVLVYACGSAITKWQKKHAKLTGEKPAPRFIETVTDWTRQLGIDKKRFKHESYG